MKDALAALIYYFFSEDKKVHPIPAQAVAQLQQIIKHHISSADPPKKS